ncbi:hypothetical protein DACRYDRAFT_60601 [Dacryopinax primogenitus]|uniref:Cap binding protein 80-PB n=1 Tax=Dacryopinax primogenitus (strain DJM 731) TaxID=1858805 RepID=M5GC50_DACPD|nr:uncharacterized protein DACRYDRAFT_60601 [Dacryopinax primogenitus]EJU06060.1 hypothetical protein DACRYDRAFT_60601 [Dacryopinax primogenitus]
MSYRGGRGRHGGGRDRGYYDGDAGAGGNRGPYRREQYNPETPEQTIRKEIYAFGNVTEKGADSFDFAPTRIPPFAKRLVSRRATSTETNVKDAIADAVRVGAVEQPYKIAAYAALLALMVHPDRVETETLGEADENTESNLSSGSSGIMDDVVKGFQSSLDGLRWREIRLTIHLFAHLTRSGTISGNSLLQLLQTFIAVLDEFGVSHHRGLQAALCAGEGVLIAGEALSAQSPEAVKAILSSMEMFAVAYSATKAVVVPFVQQYGTDDQNDERSYEFLNALIAALKSLISTSFADAELPFPLPYAVISLKDVDVEAQFSLPTLIVPPEVIEVEGVDEGSSEESRAPIGAAREFPDVYLRLFDDEVTPSPSGLTGYLLRAMVSDTINIFEVNRREAARILTELPRWCKKGVLKLKNSEGVAEGDWQLEPLLVETILSHCFTMPRPEQMPLYYHSLLTELCKLAPQTAGPAVGKSIRKLYSLLGDGLLPEVSRRFAEWFSVHMSNFNFGWVWKEWVSDISLPPAHPKRKFMRRAIELEVRLAYFDRIVQALPPPIREPEAGIVPEEAATAQFEFGNSENEHHQASNTIAKLMQGNPEQRIPRSTPQEVIDEVNRIREQLAQGEYTQEMADQTARAITFQTLLNVGSRSFSHLLNAIERYLPLLRNLAGPNGAKQQLLDETQKFWRQDEQRILIVFDKLMQYQILDPVDIINWCCASDSTVDSKMNGHSERSTRWFSTFRWEALRSAIDKANGRVTVAKKRAAALRKEDDEARAKVASAGDDYAMADNPDAFEAPTPVVDSPALANALKALATLTKEQKSSLTAALTGFCRILVYSPDGLSWEERDQWDEDGWGSWETWGWFRHFCTFYCSYLRSYANTLEAVVFNALTVPTGAYYADTPVVVKKIWSVSLGRDEVA